MRLGVFGLAIFVSGATTLMAASAEGSFDRTLSVSGPVELDGVTSSGGITVRVGRPGSVHIHAVLKAEWGLFSSGDVEGRIHQVEQNPPIEQEGNHIRIGYKGRHDILRNISMRLEIETPPDTSVHANVDSGGIHISGVHGKVECKADSGGIQIEDTGADVRAEADSGGIHIHGVHGGVFARVDSGGITAEDVNGPLDVKADSGHIALSQNVAAPIRAEADSGGISVDLAKGAGYDIHAEAESGGITAPELTVNSEYSKHKVDGKLRGGGPSVDIKVDSGGIQIH